jgi:hypothetical protein
LTISSGTSRGFWSKSEKKKESLHQGKRLTEGRVTAMATTVYESIMRDIRQNMTPKEIEKLRQNTLRTAHIYDVFPANVYQIFVVHRCKKTGLTKLQEWSSENIIRNALKKYPYVKVFIALSTTDRKSARRARVKINGRHRTVIQGKKVPAHVHIGAIGDESKSARDFVFYVASRLKKVGLSVRVECKAGIRHAVHYINYCYRQADTFHQYGNPNFNFLSRTFVDGEII